MKVCLAILVLLFCGSTILAQESGTNSNERRVSLTEPAVAFDWAGVPTLEAKLTTTGINGTSESPITEIRIVVRNTSSVAYSFVSGLVTFYDNAGVRCGEGIFKADALAADESFETDTPGVRVRCAPATWRVVATSLVPRLVPGSPTTRTSANLVITVDGEQHPIQLGKPLTLTLASKSHTIVVSEVP